MKVAILQCDEVVEQLQPRFGDYTDMIRHMFDVVDESFTFDIFDVRECQYPQDPDVYDFFITTGSKAGVYEDLPWIGTLVDYIRMLDRRKKKLIGICFGHQAIASAFGATVEKSAKGWGIGVAVNRVCTQPQWMRDYKSELNILVSHQDQVLDLPQQALLIAKSEFCPYFVVQWSEHILSIQGHPEWEVEYARARIDDRRSIIPAERIDTALESLHIEPDNKLFANWIIDFIRSQG